MISTTVFNYSANPIVCVTIFNTYIYTTQQLFRFHFTYTVTVFLNSFFNGNLSGMTLTIQIVLYEDFVKSLFSQSSVDVEGL